MCKASQSPHSPISTILLCCVVSSRSLPRVSVVPMLMRWDRVYAIAFYRIPKINMRLVLGATSGVLSGATKGLESSTNAFVYLIALVLQVQGS